MQVKLAVVSCASGTPSRRYDCCMPGMRRTALPDSSASRSSLPVNQSSASISPAGLKSGIVRFWFHDQVTVNVLGVMAVATAIGGSVTPLSVGASVAPGVLMENMARGSSDSEANPPAARRTIFEIRRRWLRCSCRVESGRASEKRNCRAFMSHLLGPRVHRKTRRCGSPRTGKAGSRPKPAYPYASGGRWVAG